MNFLVYSILLTGVAILQAISDINYCYSDLKDYSSLLFGVSSMVFTIMGIWIAFMYPNAMAKIIDSDNIQDDMNQIISDTRRVENLILSVIKSAAVITSLMVLFLIKLIFSQTEAFMLYEPIIKIAFLSIIIVLTYIQLESVFYVIKSNIDFIIQLHSERETKEHKADS